MHSTIDYRAHTFSADGRAESFFKVWPAPAPATGVKAALLKIRMPKYSRVHSYNLFNYLKDTV